MCTAGPFDNPGNSGAQEHTIKVLNWNIEGLRGALNLTDDNILSRYICTVTDIYEGRDSLQYSKFSCIRKTDQRERKANRRNYMPDRATPSTY
jgi:hypothetical protein